MLSAEQLIIVAYTHNECGVICRKCGESGMEIMGHAMSAYEAGEWAGSEGLTCEECGKEIIEPYTWTCPTCDTEYTGINAERETGCDMAQGTITVTGDDVVEALTTKNMNYERVLNQDGETLGDLLAEYILAALIARLQAKHND